MLVFLRGPLWLVIIAPALAAAGPVPGDATGTSTAAFEVETVLPPVEVRAKRSPSIDPSASITELRGARLQAARTRGEALADVVERVSGARIVDSGGGAQERRLAIRGGAPGQSLILLDGIALRSPFAGGLDLGLIGPEAIDRVALVRGGAGAALGDGALSGALLVESLRAGRVPRLGASLRAGSFSTFGARVWGAAAPVALSAELEKSGGDFAYVSRLPGLEDETRRRANNDASRQLFSLRLDQRLGGGSAALLAGAALREGGVPGLESRQNGAARERRGTALLRAVWRRAPRRARAGLEAGAHLSVLDLAYRDPGQPTPIERDTRFTSGGADGAIALRLGEHLLRLAADAGAEQSRSTEHGDVTRLRISAALSDELRLGALTLFAALRGVRAGDHGPVLLPRLGGTLELSPGARVRAALGRSLRAPAIDELFHPSEAGFAGNPALLPESAWEAEAALRLWSDALGAELTVFGREASDAIAYVNQNAFVIRPENVGAARVAGMELEAWARGDLGVGEGRLDLAASGTWSRLEASGAPLPGAPPAAVDLEVSLAPRLGGRAPLAVHSRAHAALAATANVSGTLRVEPYLRWDAGVTAEPWSGATVSLLVLNLLDHRALESLNKIPLPGRSLLVTVRLETGGGLDAS